MTKRTKTQPRVWADTSHASLCALGLHLQQTGVLATLATGCTIRQKTLQYSPAQKVTMLLSGLMSGVTSLSQLNTLRSDQALQAAFGLPGWAEQSVVSDTLSAVTEADLTAIRQATEQILRRFSRAQRHDFAASILTLDLDLSPAPASKRTEGSVRSYQGKARTTYGRKIIRVDALLQYGETLWDDVIWGNRAECLDLVKQAVAATEAVFGIAGEGDEVSQAVRFTRSRIEWRMDSGWGIDAVISYLLGRGYQVTSKFHTHTRIKRLAKTITTWQPALHAGSELAVAPDPVVFERPVQQVVVRTPSTTKDGGYAYTVFFSSRTDLSSTQLLAHYDERAGIEADLKSDKRGLGMAPIRKHCLAAQRLIVLLIDLAHNILTWARAWLGAFQPRLASFGMVRLVRDIWGIPGRVKIKEGSIHRIHLRDGYPHADTLTSLVDALLRDDIPAFLGQT